MDPITHGLLGMTTAQLGFRQRIGKDATIVALISSMIPDLDVLAGPIINLTGGEVGEMILLRTHRGISHSLLIAPLASLGIAVAWWVLRRKFGRKNAPAALEETRIDPTSHPEAAARKALMAPMEKSPPLSLMWLCSLVAMASHPLLDYCTSYGTQLLAPWTNQRFALDAIPIVDIFFTPLLLLTLVICWLMRKATRNGAKGATAVVGWLGFLLAVGYIGSGRWMHDQAIELARQNLTIKIVRAEAYPGTGSILAWRTVLETPDTWIVAKVHPLWPKKALRRNVAVKMHNHWITLAEENPEAQTFEWFAMGMARPVYSRQDSRHIVEFEDMRYGRQLDSTESIFRFRLTMDAAGEVLSAENVRHARGRDFQEMARQSWKDIWE